jgi:maltokinase
MHRCLADLEPAAIDASTVAEQAMADLRLATGQLEGLEWLNEAVVVAALRPVFEARQVPGHRIHGDLHAGQFLRAGSVMQVTDFDGNPLQDAIGRARAQSPLRDVASMLQSIAHVGSIAVKRRRPDRATDVERFTVEAMRAALDAYRTMHDVDEQMLRSFRVAQELHEYAYSIQHLPHWRYVADDALPRLLDRR